MTLNRPNTLIFIALVVLSLVAGFCRPARAQVLIPVHDSWETVPFYTPHDSWLLVPLELPTPPLLKPSTGSAGPPFPAGPVEHAPGVEQWRMLVSSYFPPEEVDRALRIMGCESNGDPWAYNRSGASGLFQLMPVWYTGGTPYGRFDPFNPEINVMAAAWLWSQSGWAPWVCQ